MINIKIQIFFSSVETFPEEKTINGNEKSRRKLLEKARKKTKPCMSTRMIV